jgi:protein-tyrosine phosphatase
MIDFHNHVIPGVDDGASTLEEALAALRELRGQGVSVVVATPHLDASSLARVGGADDPLESIRAGWERLRAAAAAEVPGLRVERGAEIMLDTPSPSFDAPEVRLAGTSFVLIEFPFMSIPPAAGAALFEVKLRGWTPVVAHPERYHNFDDDCAQAVEWRERGGLLQVNAGSLLGRYGAAAERRGWALLGLGLVDYISSDFHARGTPHLRGCSEALAAAGGGEQARLLMHDNAARMLDDLPPHPVPPLRRRGFLDRLLRRTP